MRANADRDVNNSDVPWQRLMSLMTSRFRRCAFRARFAIEAAVNFAGFTTATGVGGAAAAAAVGFATTDLITSGRRCVTVPDPRATLMLRPILFCVSSLCFDLVCSKQGGTREGCCNETCGVLSPQGRIDVVNQTGILLVAVTRGKKNF